MERNSTDVIIEDKVYKISTDQDASYVRELAEYINEKMEREKSTHISDSYLV